MSKNSLVPQSLSQYKRRTIDIALAGPFVTACLQGAYEQMSPLTVEIDLGSGLATSLAGGQIITLNTSGILVPTDLKGKTISAANFISPGGLPQIHALQDDAGRARVGRLQWI